jgi:hypothetical protein
MLGDQADSVKTYCMLPSILSHSAQNKLSFAALLSFMIVLNYLNRQTRSVLSCMVAYNFKGTS